MVNEVRTSTSSMTSVPKPLKFLRPHYATLKTTYETAEAGPAKTMLADVLSLLAMTMGEEGQRESLNYKLLGSREDVRAFVVGCMLDCRITRLSGAGCAHHTPKPHATMPSRATHLHARKCHRSASAACPPVSGPPARPPAAPARPPTRPLRRGVLRGCSPYRSPLLR